MPVQGNAARCHFKASMAREKKTFISRREHMDFVELSEGYRFRLSP